MKNKIIIPIDFEEQSILNLEWAKYYSKFNNSQIILTHIIEESSFLKKIFKDENLTSKLIDTAKEQMQKIADKNFSNNSEYLISIEKGKPYEIIEDLADEFEPEMIILGRNGNPTKKTRYLGSNTLHIISETDFPVVSIYGKNKPENCSNTILLPIDIKKEIEEQTNVALKYAKIFNSKVKAITIDQSESISHNSKMLIKMNKVKEFFIKENIEIEIEIIKDTKKENSPAFYINQVANKINPLIVIIMLRSESNYKNFFIGSVAKEIIETCDSPVLSLKPWNLDHEANPLFNVIVNPFDIL